MAAITINGTGFTVDKTVEETIGTLRQALDKGTGTELPLALDRGVIFVNPSASGVIWVGEDHASAPTIL